MLPRTPHYKPPIWKDYEKIMLLIISIIITVLIEIIMIVMGIITAVVTVRVMILILIMIIIRTIIMMIVRGALFFLCRGTNIYNFLGCVRISRHVPRLCILFNFFYFSQWILYIAGAGETQEHTL